MNLFSIPKVFTGTNGDRPDVNDTLILFTDGDAHDLNTALEQAEILKNKGVRIITIGAGKEESVRSFKPILIKMASSPGYAMTVNFEKLDFSDFVEKVTKIVCQELPEENTSSQKIQNIHK
jgi:hypothetical protein